MNDIFELDRRHKRLFDKRGFCLDPVTHTWAATSDHPSESAEAIDAIAAATWLQRESGHPWRIPVGIIGPRETDERSYDTARQLGHALACAGFAVLCGGRQGIMEAACRGVHEAGGLAIGLLPEENPACANPYASIVLATGIGEARNALIARAALCLVVVGNSYGTLSEVALGLQFGKKVIGLLGAADVSGVRHVQSVEAAVAEVAALALGL